MLSEQEYKVACDRALDDLFKALAAAADRHEFDPDMSNGTLTIAFDEPPGRFVVSPQTPVRQIWVSAHSKSYKFDWDGSAFVLNGQTLKQMMAAAVSQQMGESVTL